jgi:hypothetical protein
MASLARMKQFSLLNQIHRELGSSRLFLSFVASAENPSDPLTRPDLVWSDVTWSTWLKKAQCLAPIAALRFKRKGGTVAAAAQTSGRTQRQVDDDDTSANP